VTEEPGYGSGLPARRGAQAGYSARQKAAMIIAALGPDAAGPVIEKVGDQHLKTFAETFARLSSIPRHELQAVVAEFLAHFDGADHALKGSFEDAQNLIAHFKGEDPTRRLLEDVSAPGGRTVWQRLDSVTDSALAAYLETLHVQVIAVVLSRLSPDKASSTLAKLKSDIAKRVIKRLAAPMPVRKEALRVLADTIEREFLLPSKKAGNVKKPGEMIGALMNNLPAERRDELLAFIESDAPEILDDVRSVILTFQDIPTRVPPNAIPMLVREVEADVFLKAVKYGKQNAPQAVEYIFKNISQRMGQQYEEQMASMKQVTVMDAEAAQTQLMAGLRRLVASGEVSLIEIASEGDEALQEAYI
jgi:flagellar motor switch protein FliG